MTVVHGGNVEFRLSQQSPEEVRYAAELSVEAQTALGLAVIRRSDGDISFSWETRPPPSWLTDMAHAMLRSQWRTRQRDGTPWPRRLKRWRPGPEE